MNAQTEWISEAALKLDRMHDSSRAIYHVEIAMQVLDPISKSPSQEKAIECMKAAIFYLNKDKADILE